MEQSQGKDSANVVNYCSNSQHQTFIENALFHIIDAHKKYYIENYKYCAFEKESVANILYERINHLLIDIVQKINQVHRKYYDKKITFFLYVLSLIQYFVSCLITLKSEKIKAISSYFSWIDNFNLLYQMMHCGKTLHKIFDDIILKHNKIKISGFIYKLYSPKSRLIYIGSTKKIIDYQMVFFIDKSENQVEKKK